MTQRSSATDDTDFTDFGVRVFEATGGGREAAVVTACPGVEV